MGRYAIEPDNATKSAKAKGSNLRVHFKVSPSNSNMVRTRHCCNKKLPLLPPSFNRSTASDLTGILLILVDIHTSKAVSTGHLL